MKDMMLYKGYYGSAHFDSEDLIFYGKMEFLRAVVSYESRDAKGLYQAFKEAVDDYLAMCQTQKMEPETPFKGSLNIRLGSKLHREIAIAAALQHMTINKFITNALARAMHKRAE